MRKKQYIVNGKTKLVDIANAPLDVINKYMNSKPEWVRKGLRGFL